ncbi:putative reverse transcriptase domain-containing protein [Tanacetum coccineum]|uniref:Reverse transcriptase domain-containing protein n=1 Tax=Tanacetum coccineum TaxID=301880 RepID=A0ABQ4Y4K3_9ASTR
MSDSKDSTVTYTTVSSPFEDPYAYIREDVILPPRAATTGYCPPTADTGYVPESDRKRSSWLRTLRIPRRIQLITLLGIGMLMMMMMRYEDKDEEEEEEHLASADSVPPVHHMTARISIRDEPSISLPPREEGSRVCYAFYTPTAFTLLTRIISYLPHISSPPFQASPQTSGLTRIHPPASPIRPLGYRAAMIRLRAETPSTSHPLPLPTSSPPLQLLSSDHRTDRPEITLPPRKRLGVDLGPRYEIGEGSSAARPTGGRRADYGFVGTMDTEIRRQRAEEVGYGIRDVWEQDTQDIYAVIGDTQDRQTQIYQSVETLVDDSQYHYETARLLDQEALVSREAWGRSIEVSYMTRSEIMALRSVVMGQQAVIAQLQAADRRSQAVTSEMLQADHRRQGVIKELLAADHQRQVQLTAKRTTDSYGRVLEAAWTRKSLLKLLWVIPASNCHVKFATCTLQGNALTWWNSHVKTTTHEAAHAMPWRTLKKMMTDKYCPRAKLKKLDLKVILKAQEYLMKGCQIFLANITATKEEDKSKGKRLEDVLVVQEFPEVFPEDLPGIPPTQQVEFRIDLVHRATPVARAPYRLAPSKMKELAEQLQELTTKGFHKTNSHPGSSGAV